MKNLQLLPEDIDKLEEDTKNGKIKDYDADGFFFGNQTFGNQEYESIMDFCERVEKNLSMATQYFMTAGTDVFSMEVEKMGTNLKSLKSRLDRMCLLCEMAESTKNIYIFVQLIKNCIYIFFNTLKLFINFIFSRSE